MSGSREAPQVTGDRLDVTVLLTVYNDLRVRRTVGSLLDGDRVPDEILIADGGSDDGTWELAEDLEADHNPVRALRAPGSVAETRNDAIPEVAGDVVAFLDADELAPDQWLGELIAPIEAGDVDFAGGPTRPLEEPASRAERYVNEHEAWFYREVVSRDVTFLPMGNSAWSTRIFEAIGGFDPRLSWGGEDYDVNLRAQRAGFEGVFVEEAWVHHDQSRLDSLAAVLRKRYRYMVGATVAYRKNEVLWGKAGRSLGDVARFRHPYETLVWLLKPLALVHGLVAHRRRFGGDEDRSNHL